MLPLANAFLFSYLQLRLEKESLEAENTLLTQRSNTMQKYMDVKAPYMVLSDGIPRRQDSLESLVPDFEWELFLQGTLSLKRFSDCLGRC